MDTISIKISKNDTGVVSFCRNNQGNFFSCYFPGIVNKKRALQKYEEFELSIDVLKDNTIKIEIVGKTNLNLESRNSCYELSHGNNMILLPYTDTHGAATVIAFTFNKGIFYLDASSSIGDEISIRYHCCDLRANIIVSVLE